MDPLVPNQVRYQAAPHSAKAFIIVRIGDVLRGALIFFAKALLTLPRNAQHFKMACEHLNWR